MTSIFEPNGRQTACTIIEAGPCVVTQVKTADSDGYNALQIAFGEKKEKNTSRPQKHHFAKASTAPKQITREIRNSVISKSLGEVLTCEIFSEGEKVDIIGTSKGKGFQGVVRRHGFGGVGEATHGQHDRSRAPGSVGGSSYPSRVFKGMRMAGHMGSERVKIKGLRILKIFPEQNFILVNGSIPGHIGSIVLIQQ